MVNFDERHSLQCHDWSLEHRYVALVAPPALQEKFQGIRTAAAAVALGVEQGYSFSAEEFNAAGDEFNKKVVSVRGELSDDQLERVVGGFFCGWWLWPL